MSLWNSDRLEAIGSVMERYSKYIRPGDRIHLTIEGDDMSPYRGSDIVNAPCGTVREVTRFPGEARTEMQVEMDDTNEMRTLDNMSVHPLSTWEIEPSYIETFRGHVVESQERTSSHASDTDHVEHSATNAETNHAFRAVETQIETQNEQIQRFQKDVMEMMRHMASDLMRVADGETPEFVKMYADKYDMALMQRPDEPMKMRGSNTMPSSKTKPSRIIKDHDVVDTRHDFDAFDYSEQKSDVSD